MTTTLNNNRDLKISFYNHQRVVTTQTIFGIFNNGSVTFQNGGRGMSNWKEVKIVNLFVVHPVHVLMVISSELLYSRVDCRACPISRSRTAHNIQTVMELFPCPGWKHGWGRSHSFHISGYTSPDMAHIINLILNKRSLHILLKGKVYWSQV